MRAVEQVSSSVPTRPEAPLELTVTLEQTRCIEICVEELQKQGYDILDQNIKSCELSFGKLGCQLRPTPRSLK